MRPPEARLQVAGCDLLMVGTVAGYVPDAERVRAAFAAHRPEAVALGVPPDDLPTLATLRGAAAGAVGHDELDEVEALLLDRLREWGSTALPSPDLAEADRLALAAGVSVEAVDLADAAHTDAYTRLVKVRHLVQSNAIRSRLRRRPPAADGPYALAAAWEAALARPRGLRRLAQEREAHMAARLREVAAGRRRVLAVLPSHLLDGLAARLAQSL